MKVIGAIFAAALLGGGLAGCAAPEGENAGDTAFVHDPYENFNRGAHSVNKAVDTAVLRPVAEAYDAVTPPFAQYVVTNALNTLKLPRILANKVLQGDVEGSLSTISRFGVNTAFGIGGLLDPATEMGLPLNDTDFGVTLAMYGVGEGPYLEIPLLGPSTVRDTVGMVVDTAFDPMTYVTGSPGTEIGYGVRAVDVVETRHENATSIDQVLYESDDSYVSARAAYLQYRRREIAGEATEESLPDVFEE